MSVSRLHDILQFRLALCECVKIGIRFRIRGIDLVQLLHRLLEVPQPLFDIAAHILVGIELRLLRQIANLDAGLGACFTLDLGIDAGHDAQQRRFTGAVETQHANLCAGVEGEGDITQDLPFGRNDLADAIHSVDILGHIKFGCI